MRKYLQPTSVRMLTTLPTESQRYRESGVLTIPLKLCDPHGANLRPLLVPVELYYSAYIYIRSYYVRESLEKNVLLTWYR